MDVGCAAAYDDLSVDAKWTQGLDRLAEANRRAWVAGLRSLSFDEGMRIFEELCEAFDEPEPKVPRTHPIGLCKIWKAT
jgi:hypothetical protein